MIAADVIDRLRQEADAVAIIGEFVKLRRVGTSFRGPCPFHHGKNNNFSVSGRGGYKCFVCGETGDVFTFIEKRLGLDFVGAVKWVGAKVGVEVPETVGRPEADPREPLWEVNASAAQFFRDTLWQAPVGREAIEYLAGRGIDRESADRFELGFAPRDVAALRSHLQTLGFDDNRQRAAGLLVQREGTPDLRPRFRDRLMFPILDVSSQVVGFGGRLLRPGEPKYLNSGESDIFAKRRLLYGLCWAKQSIRKADRVIVVEGYFDLIRVALAGVEEVVAPLGTALTPEQAEAIARYTKNVLLLYDSDEPGLKATFRAADELLAHGLSVRVITLPEGEDPDTFVKAIGIDGLERAIAASVDVLDRKIQLLQRGGWFGDLRRKRRALDKLLPTMRAASDPLLRELYVGRVSEVSGVSRELLQREATTSRPRGHQPPAAASSQTRVGDRRADHETTADRAERELVRVLLHHRRYVRTVASRLDPEKLRDDACRQVLRALIAQGAEISVESIAAHLDDRATAVLQALLEETAGMDYPEEIVEGSLGALLSRDVAARMAEIDQLLPLARTDEQDALIQEKQELATRLNTLGRRRWKSFESTRS